MVSWPSFVCLVLAIRNQKATSFSPRSSFQQSHRNPLVSLKISDTETISSDEATSTLPSLFPTFSEALEALDFSTPTPIQEASATRSLDNENLLLIAPTGSGKTLAYLLPTLTRARQEMGKVLIVAPTRELAVQLMRDTQSLVPNEDDVLLTVRGVDYPSPTDLETATILIGTPPELLEVLANIRGGLDFIAGGTLSAVILDEVDVLLPLPPKALRTALDTGDRKKNKNRNTPQDERRRQEQKRKLMAARRQGIEISSDNKQVVSPTEKLLNVVASCRLVGGEDSAAPQVLGGSATASRKTLDRLNRALRRAAEEASAPFDLVWSQDVQACRPLESKQQQSEDHHTIRAVTVPTEVKHQYVCLDKESASSPTAVLEAVAKATHKLKPTTALLFLCGQFGKAIVNEKRQEPTAPKRAATSKARRNAMRKHKRKAAEMAEKNKAQSTGAERISARKACKTLATYGIEAKPLHVALGLELNAKDDDEIESTTPFFVTFEGSARGLHFDKVDAVFVVGRPASAASYLHLAGRVGRASPNGKGEVVIQPGTVVSVCTTGSANELQKWTQQIGGSGLEELEV